MLEAAQADLVFTISLKRSTLIFRYRQAGRPITPSFGAKRTCGGSGWRIDRSQMTHLCHSTSNLAALHSSVLAQPYGSVRLSA
jgi:hypothetical protein